MTTFGMFLELLKGTPRECTFNLFIMSSQWIDDLTGVRCDLT